MDDEKVVKIDEPIKLPPGIDTEEKATVYLKDLLMNMMKGDNKDDETTTEDQKSE